MYACMTLVGFDTSDKFENHCPKPLPINYYSALVVYPQAASKSDEQLGVKRNPNKLLIAYTRL